MRLPFGTETDAFRFALALAGVSLCALLVGYLAGSVAGVAVFAILGLLAVTWASAPLDGRPPLGEAEQVGHERGERDRRALVLAAEALSGDRVWDELLRGRPRPPAIEVLAPVLQSRTHYVTTDIDAELDEARARLRETLRAAREHGLDATGEVGDPIDPLAGVADELRSHDVDEVIVATHRRDHAGWLETGMLERMRSELEVPVTHVAIDLEADDVEVDPQAPS